MLAVRDKSQPGGAWRIASVGGNVYPMPEAGVIPTLSAFNVANIAKELRPAFTSWSEPELLIMPRVMGQAVQGSRLAYRIEGHSPAMPLDGERLWIDAMDGRLVHSGPMIAKCFHDSQERGHVGREDGAPLAIASVPASPPSADARASLDAEAIQGKIDHDIDALHWREALDGFVAPVVEPASNQITGTVYAYRTPDWYTDTRDIPGNQPPPAGCRRDPVLYRQAEVRVQLLTNDANETVLATTYSDTLGNYTLTAPSAGTYKVRATLGGMNWDVGYTLSPANHNNQQCGDSFEDVRKQFVAPSLPWVQIITFNDGTNPDPAALQKATMETDAHEAMRLIWDYWRTHISAEEEWLSDYVFVGLDLWFCSAAWNESIGSTFCNGAIWIGGQNLAGCLPFSGQTIVAHEFGHYLTGAGGVYGQGYSGYTGAIEGFPDAHSLLVLPNAASGAPLIALGPDMGPDLSGGVGQCGVPLRDPCEPYAGYPLQYPMCVPAENPGIPIASLYIGGKLLGCIWKKIRSDLPLQEAKSMFGAWTLIATIPPVDPSHCPNKCSSSTTTPPCQGESASNGTLIEVLVVNDDDASLFNGTPHDEEICAIFASHSIVIGVPGLNICEESAGAPQPVNATDREGAIPTSLHDIVRFQVWFQSGAPEADLNLDGVLDSHDVAMFVAKFTRNQASRSKP